MLPKIDIPEEVKVKREEYNKIHLELRTTTIDLYTRVLNTPFEEMTEDVVEKLYEKRNELYSILMQYRGIGYGYKEDLVSTLIYKMERMISDKFTKYLMKLHNIKEEQE